MIKKQSVRLIKDVLPVHYALTLKPDLEACTFSGQETITISISKPLSKISIHSKDLSIKSANIIFGKNNIPVKNISYDNKMETVVFDFLKKIPKGKAKLSVIFEGVLSDNMRGFYKSHYEVDGRKHLMATTQLESTDARRAFPCFDEPAHKAIFDVNLIVPVGKTAISNTLPTSVIEHEFGYKIVSFASTPKMSTYLLAFIVGDFEWVETKTKNGVLVRVVTVPGKSHQAKFALDITVKCLEFYEEYFDIPYPLNTLDMIAIPDFESAAMENWGAITFRESYLLVDEGNTSLSVKKRIVEVIAHELAHQWFGNLVTMEWWTHLWLNEGFASYIPYLAIDRISPNWNIWQEFTIGTLSTALKLDSLQNTHPIEVEVYNPSEIGEIFDAVSYSKGASVIRMLADYLGEKDFRNGLKYYLKKHSYKNASTVHLWEAFEKVSKKPVKKMMSIWTGKSGYPVVKVDILNNKLILTQKRYFSNISSAKKTSDKTIWPIPLSFASDAGEKRLPLMVKNKLILDLNNESWFKFNSKEASLYRVCYGKNILKLLKKPIEEKLLSPEDRLGIIRDAFSFAESGELSTTDVLELVGSYKNETEYIVWVEIISGLKNISNILIGTKSHDLYKVYAREILKDITKRVGWNIAPSELEKETLLRSVILSATCFYGDVDTISEAKNRFTNRIKNPISADLRGFVYIYCDKRRWRRRI